MSSHMCLETLRAQASLLFVVIRAESGQNHRAVIAWITTAPAIERRGKYGTKEEGVSIGFLNTQATKTNIHL